jgi:hypothetical protein
MLVDDPGWGLSSYGAPWRDKRAENRRKAVGYGDLKYIIDNGREVYAKPAGSKRNRPALDQFRGQTVIPDW